LETGLINDFPKIKAFKNKTTFSGILNEVFFEEAFVDVANYYLGANDKDSSIHEALSKYKTGEYWLLGTLNTLIIGGVMKGVTSLDPLRNSNFCFNLLRHKKFLNARNIKYAYLQKFFISWRIFAKASFAMGLSIPGNDAPTESFADTLIKTKLKKNGASEVEAESLIKDMSELKKQEFVNHIFDQETKEQQQRYEKRLRGLRDQMATATSEKDADNLIKIYDAVFGKSAIDYGVSREEIINKIKLDVEQTLPRSESKVESKKLKVENDVNVFYQNNPNIENSINEAIDIVKNRTKEDRIIKYGKSSSWVVEELKKESINIEDYEHEIDTRDLRHILNRHGEGNETQADQIPITDNDLRNIPYIVAEPDYIEIGKKSNLGYDSLIYIKQIGKGTTYYVEEIRDNKGVLKSKTMWKKRGAVNFHYTKAVKADPSLRIIPNPNSKVNQNQTHNQFPKGRIIFDNLSALIQLYKDKADQSTLLHESGHYFLKLIETFANDGNMIAQQQLEEIKDWTASFERKIGEQTQERFARAFEY
jgi:hypothetical protein